MANASLEAWDGLVQLALDRRAAFLLLAGDFYDRGTPSLRARVRLGSGLDRLLEDDVRVFIIRGDHDPADGCMGPSAITRGVKVFGETIEAAAVRLGATRAATVYAASGSAAGFSSGEFADRFKRRLEPGIHLAMIQTPDVSERATLQGLTVDDLRQTGMDYWALGGCHRHVVVSCGGPWIVYPGTLQGRGFSTSEIGAKGAVVVEADGEQVARVSFEPLDRVRTVTLVADVPDLRDLVSLRRTLTQRAEQLRRDHPGRHLMVSATLRAQGDRAARLAADHVGELLADLRQDANQPDGTFFWWDTLRHEAARDEADTLGGHGGILSHLPAVVGRFRQDPERLLGVLATRTTALDGVLGSTPVRGLDVEEAQAVLASAEAVVRDLLKPGNSQ